MTSAVKVDGERLYKKAHRGEVVETPGQGGRDQRHRRCSTSTRPRSACAAASPAPRAPTCGSSPSTSARRSARAPTSSELSRLAIGDLRLEDGQTPGRVRGRRRRRATPATSTSPGWSRRPAPWASCPPSSWRRAGAAGTQRGPAAGRPAGAGARDPPRRAHRRVRAGRRGSRPQAARPALMRVVGDLRALERRPRAVAIGTFDGVHAGHRAVIGEPSQGAAAMAAHAARC